MSLVSKIDGLASGPQGSEQVRESRKRFVRLFVEETVAKGDCVAFSITAALDGTDPTDYGYGNIVKLANSGEATNSQVIGVAAEAVTMSSDDVTNKAWKLCSVQVAGRCDFVKVADIESGGASPAPGNLLIASSTDGQAEKYQASAVDLPFAIHLVDGSNDGVADSQVLLINPANL